MRKSGREVSGLEAIRNDLEASAENLLSHIRELDGDIPEEAQELADWAEELADLVSVYFREQDWAQTMTELQQRVRIK